MKSNLLATILLFLTTSTFGQKMQVKVIQSIPTTSQYSWWTPGSSSASCNGSSNTTARVSGSDVAVSGTSNTSASVNCSGSETPAMHGEKDIHGAEIKMLLPDGRTAIAQCEYKYSYSNSLASNGSMPYRDCRTFTPSDGSYEAEFHHNNVKLTGRQVSLDGKGKKVSETYRLVGILQPQAKPAASPMPSQDANTNRREVAAWREKHPEYQPSDWNRSIIVAWLSDHGLGVTVQTLDQAYIACRDDLVTDPSALPADGGKLRFCTSHADKLWFDSHTSDPVPCSRILKEVEQRTASQK